MNKGDLVVAIRQFTGTTETSWPYRFTVPEGATGVVTSIRSTTRVRVKFDEPLHDVDGRTRTSSAVMECPQDDLALQNSEAQAAMTAERERLAEEKRVAAEAEAERVRKEREAKIAAMQPKEGDILPDDPRIQWLWRQIADKAEKAGWCATYDEVTDEFNIPGRERTFSVTLHNAGLDINTTVKAHNPKMAKEKVLAALPEATKVVVGKAR